MDNLFDKIQYLCNSRGITISEMCRQCGIPRSALTELKFKRVKTLSAITLQKIATFFNVTVEYFLTDGANANNTITGNNNIVGNGNTVGLSAQEQTLVDLFRGMDIVKQSQLIAYAAELAK